MDRVSNGRYACGREQDHQGLRRRQVRSEMSLEGWVEERERALRKGTCSGWGSALEPGLGKDVSTGHRRVRNWGQDKALVCSVISI